MKSPEFSDSIYPGFPFSNAAWLAIAFESDNYDNTRMPEWFFRSAAAEFSSSDKNLMRIRGAGAIFDSHSAKGKEIPFEWDSFKECMLTNGYSPECFMTSPSGAWACWADNEFTVWGGEPNQMARIFDEYGGAQKIFEFMRGDFFLTDPSRNLEMHLYLRRLVFGTHGENPSEAESATDQTK